MNVLVKIGMLNRQLAIFNHVFMMAWLMITLFKRHVELVRECASLFNKFMNLIPNRELIELLLYLLHEYYDFIAEYCLLCS